MRMHEFLGLSNNWRVNNNRRPFFICRVGINMRLNHRSKNYPCYFIFQDDSRNNEDYFQTKLGIFYGLVRYNTIEIVPKC